EWPHLSTLTHPGVAPYIDAFEQDEYFILVQEHVEGESLEQMLRRGVRFDEEEVRILVMEILEVLADLHDHRPPILHRDVKPSNIIQRADGRYVLVDFGALPASREGVVVGTSGYTPVEELMGHSVPASDLYGLGATAIHLLANIHPADMPIEYMQIMFRPFVDVSEEFGDFLARLVEAHADHRFASAREALRVLDGSLYDTHEARHEARHHFVLTLKARIQSLSEGVTTPVLPESSPVVRYEEDSTDLVPFEDDGPSLTTLIITTIVAFALGYFFAIQPF
ncbi:MAG: serine/threonine protein kinase, partial [Bradymonadaceae bacterium]